MKKVVVLLLSLALSFCCLSAVGEEVPSGSHIVGTDVHAGWYSILLEDVGFGATLVYLPDGCIIDVPKTMLLLPAAGNLPAPQNSVISIPADASDRLLYEDDCIKISFSDFRVETLLTSSYLKTELLIENKTDEQLEVSCKNLIVDGCAVSISKYVDVPANVKYLNEWTNSADMYLKYGIEKPETISFTLEYIGSKSVKGVYGIRTNTVRIN